MSNNRYQRAKEIFYAAGEMEPATRGGFLDEACEGDIDMRSDVERLLEVDEATTFRGDVETIVAKALCKEPERRYQSAQEFVDDIRRFLNEEPIIAMRREHAISKIL